VGQRPGRGTHFTGRLAAMRGYATDLARHICPPSDPRRRHHGETPLIKSQVDVRPVWFTRAE
jgi:hypothetical protein